MESRHVQTGLISADPDFRESFRELLATLKPDFRLGAEIGVPYAEIGAEQIRQLRTANPSVVVLDLADDPELGIRLAQFLADAQPNRRFIAAGPTLAPELLIQAMQAGISEYVPKPLTREALAPVLERVEKKLGLAQNGAGRRPGELLAFFSAKGGAGCTMIATNLAIELHRLTGKQTLLVDLDLELGEIALFLGVQPRFSFVDLVRNFHRMDAELLASYIERHDSGVHLLSAPYHPEKAETVGSEQIRKILHFLKQHYDYVVVDTSKSFSPATLATFEQADQIYLTTNIDLPSLRNIRRCFPLLEKLTGRVQDRVRLVVNRYHPDNFISVEEVQNTLGLEVYCKLSNDYEAVIGSINSGKPIVLNGNSRLTRELRALGSQITGIGGPESGRRRPLESLRRLFRAAPPRAQEALAHG